MIRRASSWRQPQAGRERGQVLALLLMLWAVLLGGLLFVFNSGQIVAAKVRLVGAADAAAYSAALWQARALNFQAYMNRAIVANEVAIAQLVSLRSWSAYMNQALQETAALSSVAPPLAPPMQALARGWIAMNDGLQRALPPLEAAASHWNVEVLSRAEYLADTQAQALVENLAHDVAVANIPVLSTANAGRPFVAINAARWRALTESHSRAGDGRARLREVVLASRDGFTRVRDWTLGVPPLISLRKRGGTDLIGYDSWRGMDTLALRTPALFGARERPLAWAAAENRRRPEPGRGDHGGSYRDNPRTSNNAARGLVARNGYAGLPAYRDVRIDRATPEPQLRYEIELRQPAATIATSDVVMGAPATVVPGEEPKTVSPAYHSGATYALSAAKVFFRRPIGRADRRLRHPAGPAHGASGRGEPWAHRLSGEQVHRGGDQRARAATRDHPGGTPGSKHDVLGSAAGGYRIGDFDSELCRQGPGGGARRCPAGRRSPRSGTRLRGGVRGTPEIVEGDPTGIARPRT